MTCEHDYKNPKRLGLAHYVCAKCGQDITIVLVLMAEQKDETAESKRKADGRVRAGK